MPRKDLELALEGKHIQVVFKGANVGLRGVLIAWDQELQILLLNELADSGPTQRNLVVPMANIQWFSFEGGVVYGEKS